MAMIAFSERSSVHAAHMRDRSPPSSDSEEFLTCFDSEALFTMDEDIRDVSSSVRLGNFPSCKPEENKVPHSKNGRHDKPRSQDTRLSSMWPASLFSFPYVEEGGDDSDLYITDLRPSDFLLPTWKSRYTSSEAIMIPRRRDPDEFWL